MELALLLLPGRKIRQKTFQNTSLLVSSNIIFLKKSKQPFPAIIWQILFPPSLLFFQQIYLLLFSVGRRSFPPAVFLPGGKEEKEEEEEEEEVR